VINSSALLADLKGQLRLLQADEKIDVRWVGVVSGSVRTLAPG
jgi:hypothetical protein